MCQCAAKPRASASDRIAYVIFSLVGGLLGPDGIPTGHRGYTCRRASTIENMAGHLITIVSRSCHFGRKVRFRAASLSPLPTQSGHS